MFVQDIQVLVDIVANSAMNEDTPSDIAKKAIAELATNFLVNQQRIADALERIAQGQIDTLVAKSTP